MSDPLDALDYYTLLGVSDDATDPEIRRAFRRFARRYHPDRHAGASDEKREKANRIYRRGSEAFRVLTEPASRRLYQRILERGMTRLTEETKALVSPATRRPTKGPSPISSVEAIAHFKRAVELANRQDWLGAWKAIRAADAAEPGNHFIEERLHKIEGTLRSRRT